MRLTRKGIEAGLVGPERAAALLRREDLIRAGLGTLEAVALPRTVWAGYGEAFQVRFI